MKELDGHKIQEALLGLVSLKLCLTPVCVGGVVTILGAVPIPLNEIQDTYQEHDSVSIPQVHIPLEG